MNGVELKKTTLNLYHEFSDDIDLRVVRVMPDIDISYALGSRLVNHGTDGQIVSGLADRWAISNEKRSVDFELREDARWSDGNAISPRDVVDSFVDTKKRFGETIPSLFESYDSIEVSGVRNIRFNLHAGVAVLQLLEKLTEPMHGIVKIVDKKASLSITSGAYQVESQSARDLILSANTHWYGHNSKMFERINMRRGVSDVNATTLTTDSWPDMVTIPLAMLKSEAAKLPSGTNIWRRNNDRLVNFSPTGRDGLAATRSVLAFIQSHTKISDISDLVDHGYYADQIYAKGLILHSDQKFDRSSPSREELKKIWGSKPLLIGYARGRLHEEVRLALEKMICAVIPFPCEFHPLEVRDLTAARREKKFHLILGGVGVDSINLDGGLSYYFEMNPPIIPSDDSAVGNFVQRLKEIRKLPGSPTDSYRRLLFDVVNGFYFLPVFHCSTTVIAREFVDMSLAPTTFETVLFELIQRKESQE